MVSVWVQTIIFSYIYVDGHTALQTNGVDFGVAHSIPSGHNLWPYDGTWQGRYCFRHSLIACSAPMVTDCQWNTVKYDYNYWNIHTLSFKKIHFRLSSTKYKPSCSGLDLSQLSDKYHGRTNAMNLLSYRGSCELGEFNKRSWNGRK